MKKVFRFLLLLILLIVLGALGLVVWLTATEYNPAPIEPIALRTGAVEKLQPGQTLELLSWNIGYGALGKNADFFMDGGKEVRAAGPNAVGEYLNGINLYLYGGETPPLLLLQEVDIDSHRSYGIDEAAYLADPRRPRTTAFALNYSCNFVPYPLPPIGKVKGGLYTLSAYEIAEAEQIALPCPFSWPMRAANLKRCLLVSRLPIEGSEKELVLINLHLEAYDDGEGKIAQTIQLRDLIFTEYEKGNYVIAGGDFNQSFPGALARYPNTHPDNWQPGMIATDLLPESWELAYDLETPSCRLLNQPYDPADTVNTQLFVIDGFLLSPNVLLESVETVDLGFASSDHNPVRLRVTLSED